MPKRSTEFQRLVYLVKKHSAAGSTVTESKFLADSQGKNREVDICIESTVDGIPVTIGIECNERQRKASVQWVEEMKGKHDDLPTDVLILYSRSGFTKGAKEKAETYRKHIVALASLDEDSAERLFNGANLLSFTTTSQKVTKVVIGVAASGDLPAQQVDAFPDTVIFNESGQEIAIVEVLVSQTLHSPKVLLECLRIAKYHHKNFKVHSAPVTVGTGDPVFLRQEKPRLLRLVESATISGDIEVRTSPLPLKHGKLEETTVAWGTVPYEGKEAMTVASKDKTGVAKASFDAQGVSVQLQRVPE
jgi:hypothetical protein